MRPARFTQSSWKILEKFNDKLIRSSPLERKDEGKRALDGMLERGWRGQSVVLLISGSETSHFRSSKWFDWEWRGEFWCREGFLGYLRMKEGWWWGKLRGGWQGLRRFFLFYFEFKFCKLGDFNNRVCKELLTWIFWKFMNKSFKLSLKSFDFKLSELSKLRFQKKELFWYFLV